MKQIIKCTKIITLIMTILILLTACWNNRDITEISLVVGIALDKSDDGKVEFTAQIVKPSGMKAVNDTGGKEEKTFVNITSTGETVFEASRNLLAMINRRAYYSHVQLIVISDKVASVGLSKFIDFFERDYESSQKAYVIIAKNMNAKVVLDSKSQMEKLPTTHDVSSLKSSDELSKSFKITLLDLLKYINEDELGVVLPILYPSKSQKELMQEDLIMEGSAVIKKDKLVGFLTPSQTRGYLYTQNKVKSTVINVPSPLNKENVVSVEVIRTKGKVQAKMENGKPVLTLEVEGEGNIVEQKEYANLTEANLISEFEKEVENTIHTEIQDVVDITQQRYQSDIFGFAVDINKNYYNEWNRIINEWNTIYSNTLVDIKVKFKISRVV